MLPLALNEGCKHPCWDSDKEQPRCKSRADFFSKLEQAFTRAFYGKAERRPADNTWININLNYRRTILKRVCHKMGVDCFGAARGDGSDNMVVDGEAEQSDLKKQGGVPTIRNCSL